MKLQETNMANDPPTDPKHEQKDPAEGDGQVPKDKPIPPPPPPGKHDKK